MNLNTIIEEEKVKFGNLYVEVEEVMERSVLDKYERFLTTAMQRAYEAGKADSAQENTPDTEWGVKNFREGLEKVCKYADTNYCPGCGLTPEGFDHLLTSRDTYWKERVEAERKRIKNWVYENCKELSDPYPFESKYTYTDFVNVSDLIDVIESPTPITNEDNLK